MNQTYLIDARNFIKEKTHRYTYNACKSTVLFNNLGSFNLNSDKYIYLLMHFLDGLGNLYLFQMENKRRLDVMRAIQAELLENYDHFSKFISFKIPPVLCTSNTPKQA